MAANSSDKVVVRFSNGKVLKGFLKDFSPDAHEFHFEELGEDSFYKISVQELKAIFFVRTFEGDSGYKEQKRYGIRKREGKKISVRFQDGELMMGYLQGDMPWDKGFFLSKPDERKPGFFLVPVDEGSNNIRVFIIGAAVKDIAAIP